jgi:hypothetical protein
MSAGSWWPTTTTRRKMLDGTFDWDSDAYKCALHQSTSNLSIASTTFAGVTNEVAQANGYLAGGIAVTFNLTAAGRGVDVKFISNPTWAAVGGSITSRYGTVYEVAGDVAFFAMMERTLTAVANAVWGTPTGDNVTITSATAALPVIATGAMFEVEGHTNAANNGLYVATGSPTASSLPATKQSGASPAAATALAVNVFAGANLVAADGSAFVVNASTTPMFTLL